MDFVVARSPLYRRIFLFFLPFRAQGAEIWPPVAEKKFLEQNFESKNFGENCTFCEKCDFRSKNFIIFSSILRKF